MSNVISVVSAITGREVASVNTGETPIHTAIQQALNFREVKNAPFETRAQLENELRNAYRATTDQEIRSELLRSIGVDHVKVSVKVTAEDAPEEFAAEESAPAGFDVVVNSAVLNAPVAEFNTSTETLDSLKYGAMEWPEVSNSSVSTQLGLIATAREVLAATEGKTFTNEYLSAVGIASVVVGDGGTVAEKPVTVPEAGGTPIYAALVAEAEAEPVEAPAVTKAEPVKFASPVPVAPASEYKPVERKAAVKQSKTVPAWVAAAAAGAGVVFGALVNWF